MRPFFMMKPSRQSVRPALYHFLICLVMAGFILLFFRVVWFPGPFGKLSGANELVVLVLSVDVVIGPILTLVIYNQAKSTHEKTLDFAVIALLQVAALSYGLWTAHQATPRFLVLEVDRFKLINNHDLRGVDLSVATPRVLEKSRTGIALVGVRKPKDAQENAKVLFESLQGGRDLAERPDFYVPWADVSVAERLARARPVMHLLRHDPTLLPQVMAMLSAAKSEVSGVYFLPLMAQKEWTVILNESGELLGYVQATGFIPEENKP